MTHDENLARVQALRALRADDLLLIEVETEGQSADATAAVLDHIEDVLTRHAPQPRLISAVYYVCRACGGVSPCVDYFSAITLLDALDGVEPVGYHPDDNVVPMPNYTHADLLAAIDEEYNGTALYCHDRGHPSGCCCDLSRDDHLDTLRAILDLHPEHRGTCPYCLRTWPCSNAEGVADALRKMGAL